MESYKQKILTQLFKKRLLRPQNFYTKPKRSSSRFQNKMLIISIKTIRILSSPSEFPTRNSPEKCHCALLCLAIHIRKSISILMCVDMCLTPKSPKCPKYRKVQNVQNVQKGPKSSKCPKYPKGPKSPKCPKYPKRSKKFKMSKISKKVRKVQNVQNIQKGPKS